ARFNVISCGWVVSALLGEPMDKAHAELHWPMLDLSGNPLVPQNAEGKPIGCSPIAFDGTSMVGAMDTYLESVPTSPAPTTIKLSTNSARSGDSVLAIGNGFTPAGNSVQFVSTANSSAVFEVTALPSAGNALAFSVPPLMPAG